MLFGILRNATQQSFRCQYSLTTSYRLGTCGKRAISAYFSSSARTPKENWSQHAQRLRFWSTKPSIQPSARLFSTGAVRPAKFSQLGDAATENPETLPSKAVGIWLMMSATLVFAIVVVGGVTRLTESGLSITEWKPITGIVPPLSQAEWIAEFEKYQATPEFKLLNHSMSLEDFKRIFYMEWGHRVLGRVLGLVFVGPLIYFAARRQISRALGFKLSAMALLIGAQGFLGWYMVKSGLDDQLMETPGAVPRVSQYRLAAHLGLAFVLYVAMFSTGLATIKDWKFANGRMNAPALASRGILRQTQALTALVFLTALSGAFVAGLDAGLLYNEFPMMGGHLVPPADELFSSHYAKGSNGMWRNFFENPTTVQFDHRVLAITTYTCLAAFYASTFRKSSQVSALTRRALGFALGMGTVQVGLGLGTLLYLVPVPLAAAHQAGSVALLTAMIHVLLTLRQPSKAALILRRMRQPFR